MGVDFFRLLQFWNTGGILYRSLLCKTSGFRLLIQVPVIQTDYTETLTLSDHDWNIDHIDFAITRSGASTLSELVALRIPFIAVPLPKSKDNHQYFNAKYFEDKNLKVPHVGCNQVQAHPSSKLLQGLGKNPDFYFTHSYRMTCSTEIGQSMCNYGSDFVAIFECGHISGVQFHPELSQKNGLRLLKNFIDLF